jgi:hypothetical protein
MADEVTQVEGTTEAPEENNVQISIEQICAAIVSLVGPVEVPLEALLTDYSKKSIAINQDEESKALTFSLVDNPETATEAE